MFTNCGSATGAGSVSISTGSAASLAGMRRVSCPAELCLVCREEADTPEHVLLRCPCLAGARLRILGTIYITPTQLQKTASSPPRPAASDADEPLAPGRPEEKNNSSLDDALHSHRVHGKGTHIQRDAADILNLRTTESIVSEDSVMRSTLLSSRQQLCKVGSVEVDFWQHERSDLLPRLLAALHYHLHGSAAHLRVLIGCYPQQHGLRVALERVTLDNGLNEAL